MSDTKENMKSGPGTLTQYLGTIFCFSSPNPPSSEWLPCDGRSLPVGRYPDLYSLIKNTYGGDSKNFKLPDLRGRAVIGQGQSTTGTNYPVGQSAGNEKVSMAPNNLPKHTHTLPPAAKMPVNNSAGADIDDPTQRAVYGIPADRHNMFGATPNNQALMAPLQVTVSTAGSGTPFPVTSPYVALNYCIAVFGIYPTRP